MALKNWFIANKHNKFHPMALRPVGLAIFFSLILAINPLYNYVSAGKVQVLGYATNISVSGLHNLTNQERAQRGLQPLSLNSTLNSAASSKANHMFANNYWAHTAPDGTQFSYFVTSAGYNYASAGENLAKNFSTSAGVMSGWMGSSGHKQNVLGNYKDVGFAVVNGNLLGEDTTLVVAMYGSKQVSPAAPQPQPKPKPSSQPSSPTPQPQNTQSEPEPEPEEPAPEEENEENAQQETNNQNNEDEEEAVEAIQPTNGDEDGEVLASYNINPVDMYNTFNWGQKATMFLLCAMILLNVMKHTLIWREQRRGLRHIWLRSHPLAQAFVLIFASIITITSSIGVIK
ncbi:MAG: CAP domain-containing protein [Candidatus Saccharibacteria bacterium]|nr:CAP domain-containing protein [Candidatus Saccharibacteria bacterium]